MIRTDADGYVLEVLKELESQLIRNLTVARNGMAKIAEDRDASRARIQAAYEQAASEVDNAAEELAAAAIDTEAAQQLSGDD